MEVKKGILKYNFLTDKYEVVFGNNAKDYELMCGTVFSVLKGSKWYETSLGYKERYFYTNNEIQPFEGQIVKVPYVSDTN